MVLANEMAWFSSTIFLHHILLTFNLAQMSIDIKQLEINVNLHCLQPNFINLELHYVVASSENAFRFVEWNEEPGSGEKKFYCFLTENELFIPAGNISLKESYVLTEEPAYPLLSNADDFATMIDKVPYEGVGKGIRKFANEDIDNIKDKLCDKYGDCEKHVITSSEAQHCLFLIKDIEISMSATMVYFRRKTQFSESHYNTVKEEAGAEVNQKG